MATPAKVDNVVILVAINNLDTVGHILLKKSQVGNYFYPRATQIANIKSTDTDVVYTKNNVIYRLRIVKFPLKSPAENLEWVEFKQISQLSDQQFSDLNRRIFESVMDLLDLNPGFRTRHYTRCNQCGWIYMAVSAIAVKQWQDESVSHYKENMTKCHCGNDYRNFRPATKTELEAIKYSTISQILEDFESLENL